MVNGEIHPWDFLCNWCDDDQHCSCVLGVGEVDLGGGGDCRVKNIVDNDGVVVVEWWVVKQRAYVTSL